MTKESRELRGAHVWGVIASHDGERDPSRLTARHRPRVYGRRAETNVAPRGQGACEGSGVVSGHSRL